MNQGCQAVNLSGHTLELLHHVSTMLVYMQRNGVHNLAVICQQSLAGELLSVVLPICGQVTESQLADCSNAPPEMLIVINGVYKDSRGLEPIGRRFQGRGPLRGAVVTSLGHRAKIGSSAQAGYKPEANKMS